jgi:hypothetical protein
LKISQNLQHILEMSSSAAPRSFRTWAEIASTTAKPDTNTVLPSVRSQKPTAVPNRREGGSTKSSDIEPSPLMREMYAIAEQCYFRDMSLHDEMEGEGDEGDSSLVHNSINDPERSGRADEPAGDNPQTKSVRSNAVDAGLATKVVYMRERVNCACLKRTRAERLEDCKGLPASKSSEDRIIYYPGFNLLIRNLCDAILHSDVELARKWLEAGADPDAWMGFPVQAAAATCNAEMLRLLVEYEPVVEYYTHARIMIHKPVKERNAEVLQIVLDNFPICRDIVREFHTRASKNPDKNSEIIAILETRI